MTVDIRGALPPLIVSLTLVGCQAELSHDLTEPEANRVVTTLNDHGIPAQTIPEGNGDERTWTVTVPSAEVENARQILHRFELPTKRVEGLAEVFDSSGLLPTPTEEQARLIRALQGELTRSLESVEGVLSARVHISIPEGRRSLSPLEPATAATTASVLLRYQGDAPPLNETQVRGLIAGAVAGLTPEAVTIVMIRQAPRQARQQQRLVALGPLAVTPASLAPLRLWLGAATGASALLAIVVVFLALRSRRFRRRLIAAEAAAQPRLGTGTLQVTSGPGSYSSAGERTKG